VSTAAQLRVAASNAEAFAAWAMVYEQQQNPLLMLAERYLSRLLPDLSRKSVLDLGCGTGRWLERLAGVGVASLCGIDASSAMLEAAAARLPANVRLLRAELPSISVESDSMDLAVASFTLSYVKDLETCATELARVLRVGGDLFIADMHPETAATLGWSRSFSNGGRTYELAFENRQILEVIEIMTSRGFSLAARLEPCFETPERELFRRCGKDAAWRAVDGIPPIYLLHFRRLPSRHEEAFTFGLHGAHCALGPGELLPASVSMRGGVIRSLVGGLSSPACDVVQGTHNLDLRGYLLFPGLVNAHDHLEFALFPRLGSGPYGNATEWARDIQAKDAETIALHKQVPKGVRLWWGGIRNLLCGVTTVSHHNPLDPLLRSSQFPVRVIHNYGWEHSLAFGGDISAAHGKTPWLEPFLVHAGEGIDADARAELQALDERGALDSRSVLIHGLAFDEADARLINERGAAVVICPTSNHFLFHKNHTAEQLETIDRLALGSDSPLTAEGDLLDEIRFAHRVCDLPAERLYRMVTDGAAQVLRLRRGEGTLRVGAPADLIAIRRPPGVPLEVLSTLSWRDVELVVVSGQVRLASREILQRLPPGAARGLTALKIEDQWRWLRGPVSWMLHSAERVLGLGNVRVGGLQIRSAEL
jgi:cytosine/adenosine deaminase-related metal-dependent hydrolase/ubiquinone/menaquinone biosynthesis C-methylase UbiE